MGNGSADEQGSIPRTQVSPKTLRRLEHASGGLANSSIGAMEQRLPWFRRLPADQRASVLLVTQTGVSNFVSWLQDPTEAIRLTAEAFRSAPKDLSQWVSLRQTVEMVRAAIDVFEQQLPDLAEDESERTLLTEAILRYTREIAFAAATSYAAAAESRGAWDARLEALVVDGIVRGDTEESLLSRAAALGWEPSSEATVLVGNAPSDDPPSIVYQVRSRAARAGRSVLLGVQGSRLVVVFGEPSDRRAGRESATSITEAFGEGPVVVGPTVSSLTEAHRSASDAMSALRAVVAWPAAPRPVPAEDLLPERALAGDPEAERQLIEKIMLPLVDAGSALMETVDTYLEVGGVLESCARQLYVHPNTVRYRLRRVSEITGRTLTNPRDALILRTALAVGRLAKSRGLW
ncbi:DNA-binding PucR family transcriptional regulator [Halopolyspora algeriensis]|uniref:DNA-binding PucR family transcriptional regulator n=1 Tax=Halopolyspora algeriensis TaxID=1500506 RepID=A0A368VM47_9ACTN|nr:helix-turn-helix domain-containing protein [Halopolyspora algeriensis]RCW40756.1 DNA-binding PucR family transcriptional regulator [Halopolyspora algeriensis]TQM53325.1 DNA-binding PucR family transcriptional regulator [Halopolyspora algeriensis]